MTSWWNDPLLIREIAAYLLRCVLTVWWLAKIVSDAGKPSDGKPSRMGRVNDGR
jgi:hypothetical protein